MSLKIFTEHLRNVGLNTEAQALDAMIAKPTQLELELTVIKTPERRLTAKDISNYYAEIRDKILKGLCGNKLVVVQKNDKTDFITLPDNIVEQRKIFDNLVQNMLTLRCFIGAETDNLWVELMPGKEFEFARVKKAVPNIVELIRSIPGAKNVDVYFTGNNGFCILGKLKDKQNTAILQKLLRERLEDFVADKTNIIIGEPITESQLGLDISNFKNTGGFPAPYSLNKQTGLVVVPVDNIDLFRKEYAEIRRVLGHKPRGVTAGFLKFCAAFDPSKISSTSANIGSIKIDSKLDVSKIKDALKLLQDNNTNAFAKVRDFDYIISDISAKEAGMSVPSGKAGWFNPSYTEVCFLVKSYVDSASKEDIASTLLHEAQHERYPGYGEWTAEHEEEKLQTARLLRKALLVVLAAGGEYDPRRYARELQKGFGKQAEQIIEDAKKVKDRASWAEFRHKYSEADVMRAYAMQVAIATLSKVFKSVDPEIRLDIFNRVLYDPERKYGVTKAYISYDPAKTGAKALNGYINDHINNGIMSIIKEIMPEVPEEKLSEKMDEGESEAPSKETTLHEVGDFDVTTRDLKRVIEKLRNIISTQWKDDAILGTTEQSVDLFNYFISQIVTHPAVSEVFADQPYLSKEQILEKRNIKLPSIFCYDCGITVEIQHNWQSQISKFEKEGCPNKAAKEHQINWTDGVYNKEKAITDPAYKYRIGLERAPGSGSSSGKIVTVAGLKKLSRFAAEEEDIFSTPELEAPSYEKHEKIVDVSLKEKEYIDSLNKESYEYRRIKGLNLKKNTPDTDPNIIDSVSDFEAIRNRFYEKLQKSLTTAPYFESFKKLVGDLSNLVEERQYRIR